jgi:ABC-2 type transport system ATP-binding protein
VEELCDSIALLDKGHKILDGRVTDIKRGFRTNTYLVEYEGPSVSFAQDAPFQVLETHVKEHLNSVKIRINEGATANEVLQYLLPQTAICGLHEIIPSMNEIFIQTVNKTNHK